MRETLGCYSTTKCVYLKYDKFAFYRNLSGSFETPEDYPGWKKCKKVAFSSKCDKQENSSDYQEEQFSNTNLQGSIEKEKEEVGTMILRGIWYKV